MIALATVLVVLFAAASDTHASDGGSYYAPPCPRGKIRWVDGSCFAPVINKRFFTFQSPQHRRPKSNVRVFNNPNRDYNYVFVRAPEVRFREQVVIGPPKQQSLIYLLSQGNQVVPREVIQLPAQNDRPEVYYINYNDPNEDLELPGGINLQTALAQQTHTGQFISSSDGPFGTDTSLFARLDQIQEFQGPQTVQVSLPSDKTVTGIGATGSSSFDLYRQPNEDDSQVTSSVIQEVTFFNTASSQPTGKDGSASGAASSSAEATVQVADSSADSSSLSEAATDTFGDDDGASSSKFSSSSSSDDASSSLSTSSDSDDDGDDGDEGDSSVSSSISSSSASGTEEEQGSSVGFSSSASVSVESSGLSSADGDDGGSAASASSSSSSSDAGAIVNSKELTASTAESGASSTSAIDGSGASSVISGAESTAASGDLSDSLTAKSSSSASSSSGSEIFRIPVASSVTFGSSAQSVGSVNGGIESGTSASSLAGSTSVSNADSVIDIAAPVLGSNTLEVVQVDSQASTGSIGGTETAIAVDPVADFISSIGGGDSTDDASATETQSIAQNIADLGLAKSISTGESTASASAASASKSSLSEEGRGTGKSLASAEASPSLTDVISGPVAFQSGPALGADVTVKHVSKIVSKI